MRFKINEIGADGLPLNVPVTSRLVGRAVPRPRRASRPEGAGLRGADRRRRATTTCCAASSARRARDDLRALPRAGPGPRQRAPGGHLRLRPRPSETDDDEDPDFDRVQGRRDRRRRRVRDEIMLAIPINPLCEEILPRPLPGVRRQPQPHAPANCDDRTGGAGRLAFAALGKVETLQLPLKHIRKVRPMAVPKRRQSKSRSAIRRAQVMKQAVPNFVPCPRCGEPKLHPPDVRGLRLLPRPAGDRAEGRGAGLKRRSCFPCPARIAVDAMGSDAAPRVEVEGVLAAVRARGDRRSSWSGDEARLRAELDALGAAEGADRRAPRARRHHHARRAVDGGQAEEEVVDARLLRSGQGGRGRRGGLGRATRAR